MKRSASLDFSFSSHAMKSGDTFDAGDAGAGEDLQAQTGQKRKRYTQVVDPTSGKKRKVVDVKSFHPVVQEGVERLKALVREGEFFHLLFSLKSIH